MALRIGVVLLLLLQIFSAAQACPNRCLCFRTTVRCMFLQLDHIPDVPAETTILDLRFNRIQHIPAGAFRGLQNLNTLLLNNNHIKRIGNRAFEGLTELRYLYLYKNQIKTIESRAFQGLEKLEQLYIHFNNIDQLAPDTFHNLHRLERLFLHNNQLTRIPEGIFSHLESLRRLRLDSNALVCDCQMMWFAEMLKEKRGSTQTAATCNFPQNLQGKSLQALSIEEFHCEKPEIRVPPTDVDTTFGSTAYFTCKATGDPDPEIIWFHNNNEIVTNRLDENSRYSLLADGTLMIQQAQDSDQGVYECMARNIAGEVKATAAALRYFGDPVRPRLLRTPKDVSVKQGENVAMECVASGHPAPQISWTKNDYPLGENGRYTFLSSGSLMITDIQYEDRGIYRCTASNRLDSASATAIIRVNVHPSFSERPRDQTIVEGHSVEFRCVGAGHPSPQLSWTKDGVVLSRNDNRYRINADGSILRLDGLRPVDKGIYRCVAENLAGRKEAEAELVILPKVPPHFTRTPTDVETHEGVDIELPCSAHGDPLPGIKWVKDDVILENDSKYRISADGYLIIRQVQQSDQGIYRCEAVNGVGTAFAAVRVNVRAGRVTFPGDHLVNASVTEAISEVNKVFNNTLTQLYDRSRPRTPSDLLALFRLPHTRGLEIARATEVFERTLEIIHTQVRTGHKYNLSGTELRYQEVISPNQLEMIANMSNCHAHRRVIDCKDMCYHHKYRTFDGTCNNLQNPMWGSSLTPLNRLLRPAYENGFNTPVGWNTTKTYYGHVKPSARLVSTTVMSAKNITHDERFTHMLMQWGQFVDHDLDFTPMAVGNARFSDGRFCNESCEYEAPCFPIKIPENDPRIHRYQCMGFTRSSAICASGTTSVFFNSIASREQLNEITSYMDASNIYGSSEEDAQDLRDLSTERGLLKTGELSQANTFFLPPNVDKPVDCQMDPNNAHIPCFLAGDHRSNEQLGLLSMHTIWMREHNRIATALLRLNPHWDGNMLYHEARKIVGAQMQYITFNAWVPKILGPAGMELLGEYKGYNPNLPSSILNVFATAAFRFGHSLINPVIYRLNATMQPIPEGNLNLHQAFFAPFRLVEEGGVDPILRGLFGVGAKKLVPGEGILNTELTERLFMLAHALALDLAAINIQRGRDHGLPPYNEWRRLCNLTYAESFSDLDGQIRDPALRQKLQDLYGHVGNIDLFVGGMSEDPIGGAKMGPTFMCIIAEQFRRLRDGDRFYLENPGVFNPAQLTQLRQTSLARVICDNSDNITQVPRDVFTMSEYPKDFVKCADIPKIDLKMWTDCCHDCSKSGEFNSITSHYRKRRSAVHSYPEDQRGSNDVPSQERPQKDSLDIRIDGVEGLMDQLKKTVKTLHKKVRRLERRMKFNKKLGASEATCTDELGRTRANKERWKVHDCKECQCKAGQMECHVTMCPIPTCDSPRKLHGQCCPVC